MITRRCHDASWTAASAREFSGSVTSARSRAVRDEGDFAATISQGHYTQTPRISTLLIRVISQKVGISPRCHICDGCRRLFISVDIYAPRIETMISPIMASISDLYATKRAMRKKVTADG